jgi:phosphatidylglycerol lysyltransferase
MDYLLTELMLWGRAQGFAWFDLGMAPLAGVSSRKNAPTWNRVAELVYRHGEHFYNFEGLRQYKQKFDPEWSSRYLACEDGLDFPLVLADLTTLIGGGALGVLRR